MIKRMKIERGSTDYRKYSDLINIKTSEVAVIVGILKDMKIIEPLEGFAKESIRLTELGMNFQNFIYFNAWQRHNPYSKFFIGAVFLLIVYLLSQTLKILLHLPR
jgi:hypothetical protein